MVDFNSIYPEVLLYAKKAKNKSGIKYDAEEIVSEAFLLSGENISLEILKKNISRFINATQDDKLNDLEFYNIHHNLLEKQCKKCMEVLPIAMFAVQKKKRYCYNKGMCRKCFYQHHKKIIRAAAVRRYKTNKESPDFKLKLKRYRLSDSAKKYKKEYNKKYKSNPDYKIKRKKHDEKWKQKKVGLISDKYIINMMSRKEMNTYIPKEQITPEMIIERRNKILKLRGRKSAKNLN